jgi:hypothetical protein
MEIAALTGKGDRRRGRGPSTLAVRIGRAALFLALLAPCFWQPRIQAGDLSSHVYNSWLTRMAESGRAQGLSVAPQATNVLFDLMLGALFRICGPDAAQRISVGVAALLFLTGAFAFVSAASGRQAWNVLPCIAMLAYGWVFHMGFFNFYLAMGLSLWAMALLWRPRPWRVAAAVALLALAYLAHALPVVWCVASMGYVALARRLSPRQVACLTAAVLLLMAVLSFAIQRSLLAQWYPAQIANAVGADQVWVFGLKFGVTAVGLLFVWGLLALNLVRSRGAGRVLAGIPFQLAVLTAGGVLIFPSAVLLPGFLHALGFIAERMSLGVAVCVCALVGAARPRPFERFAAAALALAFFAFLYADERALNRFEDRMEAAVARLEPGHRVISRVADPDLRVNALAHMVDRVCVGRCFSYANYEPSSAAFRLRARAANPFVAWTIKDSKALESGTYVVKPADVPIYAVDVDQSGRVAITELKAGERCGSTHWKALPDLFSAI